MVDRKVIHILAMLIGAGSEPTGAVLQGFFQIVALNQPAIQKAQAGAYSAWSCPVNGSNQRKSWTALWDPSECQRGMTSLHFHTYEV